jgi:hypothetical protein
MSLIERIRRPGPKRLLAVDGGGIRGVLSLGVLEAIEAQLAKGNPAFRLSDYFDYISGTSTGGIIAAGLACGMSVAELVSFYKTQGAKMFAKAGLLARLHYTYESEPLALTLQSALKAAPKLGSDGVRTLLLLVMRNASTDSPWPISNNPFAKYNARDRKDCNLEIPLWQLVRASTAAPTYFPPEVVNVGRRPFVFVDGGVTMYNNPAFQMFLMATLKAYWPGASLADGPWKTGEKEMLIVSVGTGTSPGADGSLEPGDMHLLFNATSIPSALMFAALNEQDLLCRAFGKCVSGDPIDREVGTLMGEPGPGGRKHFTYARYNAELTRAGLDAIGCNKIEPAKVQQLDSVDAIDDLLMVGRAVAKHNLKPEHFAGF